MRKHLDFFRLKQYAKNLSNYSVQQNTGIIYSINAITNMFDVKNS